MNHIEKHMTAWFSAIVLAAWVIVAAAAVALAQEHSHPSKDADLHDRFYAAWNQMPARTSSCCSKHDCYPTTIKNVGGTFFGLHRESGRFVVIPAERLEQNAADPRESPDHQSHMCANPQGVVYCATVGSGL